MATVQRTRFDFKDRSTKPRWSSREYELGDDHTLRYFTDAGEAVQEGVVVAVEEVPDRRMKRKNRFNITLLAPSTDDGGLWTEEVAADSPSAKASWLGALQQRPLTTGAFHALAT